MTTLKEHKALLNELGQDRSNGYLVQTMLVAMCDIIEHLTAAPKAQDDEYILELELSNQTHVKRIHELENTIKQLKEHNEGLKKKEAKLQCALSATVRQRDFYAVIANKVEQSGCRKYDAQPFQHEYRDDGRVFACKKCGAHPSDENAEPNTIPMPNDGWIPWSGGACPVPQGTKVRYKLRGFPSARTQYAEDLDWLASNSAADIIAYRIAE